MSVPKHRTEVNAGPLEICRIFLGSPQEYPTDKIEKLRQKMREFVLGCHAGVLLNKKLISADQLVLQEKLEEVRIGWYRAI